MQPPAGQPGLQDQEALSGLAEQGVGGHPHIVVVHQGMPRLVRVGAHQVVVGLQHQALGAGRD